MYFSLTHPLRLCDGMGRGEQGWTADDYEVGEKGAAGHFDDMVRNADSIL